MTAGQPNSVRSDAFWTIGRKYKVKCTVSGFNGTGLVTLPYDGTSANDDVPRVNVDGYYEYIYTPNDTTSVFVTSGAGVDVVVTIHSITEINPGIVYSIDQAQMYFHNEIAPAVFVGECSIDGEGNVFDIQTYAPGTYQEFEFSSLDNSVYCFDSPWGHGEYEYSVWWGQEAYDQELLFYYNGSYIGGYLRVMPDDSMCIEFYTAYAGDKLVKVRRTF
jgi:hypothetical protein